jgi:hypothetical protein
MRATHDLRVELAAAAGVLAVVNGMELAVVGLGVFAMTAAAAVLAMVVTRGRSSIGLNLPLTFANGRRKCSVLDGYSWKSHDRANPSLSEKASNTRVSSGAFVFGLRGKSFLGLVNEG